MRACRLRCWCVSTPLSITLLGQRFWCRNTKGAIETVLYSSHGNTHTQARTHIHIYIYTHIHPSKELNTNVNCCPLVILYILVSVTIKTSAAVKQADEALKHSSVCVSEQRSDVDWGLRCLLDQFLRFSWPKAAVPAFLQPENLFRARLHKQNEPVCGVSAISIVPEKQWLQQLISILSVQTMKGCWI